MAIVIRAKQDESTDSVIKRFKRRVVSDDILRLAKRKDFYMKPALQRKEKNKEIARKLRREQLGLPPRPVTRRAR